MFFYFILFLFPKIPDAEKDPDCVALKGRAYLNKGQVDQAFKVWKKKYSAHGFHLFLELTIV